MINPSYYVAKLRSFGVESTAFELIEDLERRPFLPPVPRDEANGIAEIHVRMADGDLTWAEYKAYMIDAAMWQHRATPNDEARARELRRAEEFRMLTADGENIGAQMRAIAHGFAEDNRAAHERMRAADVRTERDALRRPKTASDWATANVTHESHHEAIAFLSELIDMGIVARTADEARRAFDATLAQRTAESTMGRGGMKLKTKPQSDLPAYTGGNR